MADGAVQLTELCNGDPRSHDAIWLSDLGIENHESSRWQKVAAVSAGSSALPVSSVSQPPPPRQLSFRTLEHRIRSASSFSVTFQPTRRASAAGSISRHAPAIANYVVRTVSKV